MEYIVPVSGGSKSTTDQTGSSDDSAGTNHSPPSRTPWDRIKQYAKAPVRVDAFVEIQLLVLTFSTGVQDADSIPNFRCFASNQTGNTVLLALGLSGFTSDLFNLHNVSISLAMFVAGAIITGQLGNWIGRKRRWWQVLANFCQSMMVLGTAAMQFAQDAESSGPWALAAIALLAFSSGAQVATARAMRIPEISTAMATAAWVDLVIDPHLLSINNRPRNRRTLFLVALVAGSFVGAIMRTRVGSSWALLVSGLVKATVTAMLFMTRSQVEEPRETLPVMMV